MFINVSMRTDIAAHYSEWFMNRIRAGEVYVRNPMAPEKVSRYRLDPRVVDGIIFCTKNPGPMLPHLSELRERGFSSYFQVTITSYGRDIEPGVLGYHEVMENFRRLSDANGKESVTWRYDPILLTETYTAEHHLRCFEEMAEGLSGYTDDCIISFVKLYRKLGYTFPKLRAVSLEDRRFLLKELGQIGSRYGLSLRTCGDGNDYSAYGIGASGCVTASVLGRAFGKRFEGLKEKPTREGCGCVHTSDIGAYDTCPNGCRYCYAVRDHGAAADYFRRHDPKSPVLGGGLSSSDVITDVRQKRFASDDGQITMELW